MNLQIKLNINNSEDLKGGRTVHHIQQVNLAQ